LTKSYVIIGGLGGVGLELADWLILREARKLVLVSRSGVKTGYQAQRIRLVCDLENLHLTRSRLWRSYGVEVQISTRDVTTKQGCLDLIREATELGSIDAIFNLAVVLKDALLEDQTEKTFRLSLAPKARTTTYLDEITREICPHLRSVLSTELPMWLLFALGILSSSLRFPAVAATPVRPTTAWPTRSWKGSVRKENATDFQLWRSSGAPSETCVWPN
jgi:NAD(P)-dependent dehydrogenase (short-subunit alcohol dehydrogenase family)